MSAAITAEGLSKQYQLGRLQQAYGTLRESLTRTAKRMTGVEHQAEKEYIWALRDVSFQVDTGEVLGVIGRNGAGKSTLLKVLTRITTPTTGRATIRGRVGSLLEVGTGFHPELTGRENIFLNGSILGMKRREIQSKIGEIIEFSGVDRFIDTPVKRYSSGMYVRLAFSVAAHLEPEILLVDEVLAVGDAEFQQRCLGRMEDLSGSGRTILFVSHNMQAVNQLCDRAILLESGSVAVDGPAGEVVTEYLRSSHGTGSRIEWPDETAPGDDLIRLRSVRIVDEDGESIDSSDVRRPVGIEIGFRVLRDGPPVFPKIKVHGPHGEIAFNAHDVSPRWDEPSSPGTYVATAWIPANFLNEGTARIDVAVCSIYAPKLYSHAAKYDAVGLYIYDPGDGDSARGSFVGELRGSVRPLLDWTAEQVD
jgi:lipopolysaccharide transport system ATP-binding protein